jgi:hypothetical protein
MPADSGNLERSSVFQPQTAASPYAGPSVHTESESRPVIFSLPSLRGFSDGFVGGLIGGGVFGLLLIWLQTEELLLACVRVATISVALGGFEMWRVTQRRSLNGARVQLLWTLASSMLVLWALGTVLSATDLSTIAPPLHPTNSLALRSGNLVSTVPPWTHIRNSSGNPRAGCLSHAASGAGPCG